nr:hypothetical protein [Actinoplanes sp. TBRC 11911]
MVLVHAVEHRRDQIADRVVLGVIHDRDQRDACPAEIALGDRRIDAVAVKSGTGVDDHVVDVGLSLKPGHHLLEYRPAVDRGRGAAGFDELGGDLRIQFYGSALDGRALRWKGDALRVVVGVHLTGRRDTQVDESALPTPDRPVMTAGGGLHLSHPLAPSVALVLGRDRPR